MNGFAALVDKSDHYMMYSWLVRSIHKYTAAITEYIMQNGDQYRMLIHAIQQTTYNTAMYLVDHGKFNVFHLKGALHLVKTTTPSRGTYSWFEKIQQQQLVAEIEKRIAKAE